MPQHLTVYPIPELRALEVEPIAEVRLRNRYHSDHPQMPKDSTARFYWREGCDTVYGLLTAGGRVFAAYAASAYGFWEEVAADALDPEILSRVQAA